MYQVGEYMIYGNHGVCKVIEIGNLPFSDFDEEKIFYTLQPIYTGSGKIFTPVENGKVKTRRLLTQEEALHLIDEAEGIEPILIADEKNRERRYKEALHSCDDRLIIAMIKTIQARRQSRIAQGKKSMALDEKYLLLAEETLYHELEIVLDETMDQVKERLESKLGEDSSIHPVAL